MIDCFLVLVLEFVRKGVCDGCQGSKIDMMFFVCMVGINGLWFGFLVRKEEK